MDWEFIGIVAATYVKKDGKSENGELSLFVKIISGLPFYGVKLPTPQNNIIYSVETRVIEDNDIRGQAVIKNTLYQFNLPCVGINFQD